MHGDLTRAAVRNNSNPATVAFEEWLARGDTLLRIRVQQYRDFYDGGHDVRLTARQEQRLGITTAQIRSLANVCQLVVDVVAERLAVDGFDAADARTAETLAGWWQDCDLDAYQDDVHLAALRDGDGFLLVEWDNAAGRPTFWHELGDDGYNGAGVVYSSERRIPLYGYKRWRIEEGGDLGAQRLNLYFPDRIERFITGRMGIWTPYASDTERHIEPWVDGRGQPLGVPMIHFPTNPNGMDYGTSELEAVLPLQRVLTSLWVDLLAAADATGFQIVTLTGDTPAADMVAAAGAIWYSPSPDAAWGAIAPGDTSRLVEAIRHTVMTIAQVSRIPITMFQENSAPAAADTVQASERGLVAKVNDRAKSYGLGWRAAMRQAVRLHNAFGRGPALSEDGIRPRWASFERVDPLALEAQRAAVAAAHSAAGLGIEAAYGRAGYPPDVLAEIMRTDTAGAEGLEQ